MARSASDEASSFRAGIAIAFEKIVFQECEISISPSNQDLTLLQRHVFMSCFDTF